MTQVSTSALYYANKGGAVDCVYYKSDSEHLSTNKTKSQEKKFPERGLSAATELTVGQLISKYMGVLLPGLPVFGGLKSVLRSIKERKENG